MKSYQSLCLNIGLGIGLGLALLSIPAQAITSEEVPNPRAHGNLANSWISDTAHLVSPENEAQLNQMLSALEAENGTEMAIVTVETTFPAASPRAFATDLFNAWGVGKADADNGVVFLISLGDRRAEVVVGYGLESILTQSKIEELLQQEAVPDFKQGSYDQGILAASKAIVSELSNSPASSAFGRSHPIGLAKILVALSGGGLALMGVWLRRPPKKCRHCQNLLQKMSKSQLLSYLSDAQKVAVNIGSAHYSGWQCSSCDFFTIQRHQHWFKGYKVCDRCQEPTLTFSSRKTLTRATRYQSGEAQVTRVCLCCHHVHTDLITLARLSGHSNRSSGGGGFGGGSSGGGGGGSSW